MDFYCAIPMLRFRMEIVMNNEYVHDLRKKVKKELKKDKSRYWHTIGVAQTAANLAMCYEVDIEKAFVAGLLHDCAKCYTNEQLLYYCSQYQIEINEYEQASPYLLHSKLGAYFAKSKYGIEDNDIINAILFHTTGRPKMSKLEEIVFIADYIEPYRNRADDLDIIRKLAYKDIQKAILKATEDTLYYLKNKGKEQFIDALSVQTYEYYKEQCKE